MKSDMSNFMQVGAPHLIFCDDLEQSRIRLTDLAKNSIEKLRVFTDYGSHLLKLGLGTEEAQRILGLSSSSSRSSTSRCWQNTSTNPFFLLVLVRVRCFRFRLQVNHCQCQ
jgi:hypothetical protein